MQDLINDIEAAGFTTKIWHDKRLYVRQGARDCGWVDLRTKIFSRCNGAPRMSSETINPIVQLWADK